MKRTKLHRRLTVIASALPLLVLSACGGGESPDAASAGADVAATDAAAAAAPTAKALMAGTAGTAEAPDSQAANSSGEMAASAGGDDSQDSAAIIPANSSPKELGTVIPPTSFSGKGWYVDSVRGSDANPGTQSAPWKTLAKASSATLAPGDAILLRCGETWRESLSLGGKKTPLAGVTVGIYGSCTTDNRPVITGVDPIQGVTWTLASGFGGKPVYSAKWPQPVSQLYWEGVPIRLARHPNYGGIGAEFNLVQQVKTPTSFVLSPADVAAMANTDLAGATVRVRTEPWKTEPAKLASFNRGDGTATLSAATSSAVNAGEGYILMDHKALLDAPGEWFYEAASGTLYVYTPTGQSPATGVLMTHQRSVGASLRNTTDARVENLHFAKHGSRSLELIDAPRTVVTDVTSKTSGDTGIYVNRSNLPSGSQGTRIVRALVQGAASMGIHIANSPAVTVESSTITWIGTDGQPNALGVGVQLSDSSDIVFRSNTVANLGSSAFITGRVSGVSMVGNVITKACMRFTDCGAIYEWGTPGGSPRNTIRSNLIANMTPNTQGAVGGAPGLVAGIYFDMDSGRNDVIGNMISKVGVGLKLHNSSDNRFAENHVWPVDSASISIHSGDAAKETVRGNVIENNLLYGANSLKQSPTDPSKFEDNAVRAQIWIHTRDARSMFTGTNPNIVRNNTTGSVTDKSSLQWELVSAGTGTVLYSAQWADISPGEQQLQAFAVNPVLPRYEGSNLIVNGVMAAPGSPWVHSRAPGSVGATTFGSCDGGCAVFTAGAAKDSLSGNEFSMSSATGDNLYLLRFKGQSLTGAPLKFTASIARKGGDWSSLGLSKWITVSADAETVSENFFSATASDIGRLAFIALEPSTLRIREVSLQKVASVELLDPLKETALVANETSVQKVVDCAASGLRTCSAKQLNGQPVLWPITLPANSAMPVVAADGKWLRAP